MTARIFNVLIGVWLVVSAFAWPHSAAMTRYTVACGVLTAILAIAMLYFRPARYFNLVVAALLFSTSAMMSPRTDPTFWNNLIAAISIFVATLLGGAGRGAVHRERELYGRT
jgi:heme A synthase